MADFAFSLVLFTCCCLAVLQGVSCAHLHALRNKHPYGRLQAERELFQRKAEAARLMNRVQRPSASATNPQDKAALEAFYRSTDGSQWAQNTGWMKGDPCQDGWLGVYCNEEGRVIELTLVYNVVGGSLPAEMTQLDALQILKLYSNSIEGEIPTGMFSMRALQVFDVNYNQLSGGLPDTVSMPNLTNLVLYDNQLTGRLPTTWNTPSVQVINLADNILRGPLPPAIGRLNLTQLLVSNNRLSGSLPEEYGSLNNLQQFWLFENVFDDASLPSSWSGMTSMLSFEADMLSGPFPSWIGSNWLKVEVLNLVDGKLSGEFPTSFCGLKKLQFLHLFNNSLSGQLPDCVCNLPQSLQSFQISDNNFTGSIPECIGNLNLTDLYFSRNSFSGLLPRSIGNMKYLELLDVSGNKLYGSVPSTYANLKGVTVLFSLCYNKLSGIEDGLGPFLNFVKDYQCLLYDNPWNCPLPSFVPKECRTSCSYCNSGDKHTSCSTCVGTGGCGWCSEGPNCLDGTSSGPEDSSCKSSDWTFGSASSCP